MRPRYTPSTAEWAGTVQVGAKGLCGTCYDRQNEPGEYAPRWPVAHTAVDQLSHDEALQALCAQADPEAFFPEKGGSNADAKRICARCPIRLRCLEVAIANNYSDGVWGGLSPRQRRAITGETAVAA
jgi:WhiB family redox-sensing transcriptional regulator